MKYTSISALLFVAAFALYSCEVEKIQPGELPDETINNDTIPDVVDATPPCVLTQKIVRFNNYNYNMANAASYSPPVNYVSNSNYQLNTYALGGIEMDVHFIQEPQTGFYITKNGTSLDQANHVMINILYDGYNFKAANGDTVYVQHTNDTIKVSYCNLTFNGPITISGSKGQIIKVN